MSMRDAMGRARRVTIHLDKVEKIARRERKVEKKIQRAQLIPGRQDVGNLFTYTSYHIC